MHKQRDDILLNCAQMRSSQYFKSFRAMTPFLNREAAIHEGALRELAERSRRNRATVADEGLGDV